MKEKAFYSIEGVVVNFRVGLKTQKNDELLISIPDVNDASKASKYIGRKVLWKSGEKKIMGKIVDVHGKNGVVRAKFKHGLPGIVVGSKVIIL